MSVALSCPRGALGAQCRSLGRRAARSASRSGSQSGNAHANHGRRLSMRRLGLSPGATSNEVKFMERVLEKALTSSQTTAARGRDYNKYAKTVGDALEAGRHKSATKLNTVAKAFMQRRRAEKAAVAEKTKKEAAAQAVNEAPDDDEAVSENGSEGST